MDSVILDDIPFQLDTQALLEALHVRPRNGQVEEFQQLCQAAQAIGQPRACYRQASVEIRAPDYVVVEGVRLSSRLLSHQLRPVSHVFAYVATCGPELEAWATSFDNLLLRFWADALSELALRAAANYLDAYLAAHHHLGHLAQMNPGSLEAWPITEQQPLFHLLGPAPAALGVHLTDSLLMIPRKSVSGLQFPSAADFASCQLCLREKCPNRRAAYDPALQAEYAALSGPATA